MTNATSQIAAENQRKRIPDRWLIEFNDMTNDELTWFSENATDVEVRAWCGWEMDYREAFGIEVYIDSESGELKRKRR